MLVGKRLEKLLLEGEKEGKGKGVSGPLRESSVRAHFLALYKR